MTLLRTKPPLKFYTFLAFSIFFTTYLFIAGMVLWGALIYGLFGIVLLYWIACGKDCRIGLNNESLIIKFHKTFWKKKILPLIDIDQIEFIERDPFWKLIFMSDKIERHYRSFDKLVLIRALAREEILINTNHTDLHALIAHFKTNRNGSY
jgi:hypothetical protein